MIRSPIAAPSAITAPVAEALARELRAAIAGEVRFDDGSRALYATDASNYRQVPIGVVVPRTVEDIVETVRICRNHGAPILPRGAGTSLCGQTCNVAVVLDASKYLNRVLEVNAEQKYALVEPGTVCDELRRAAESHRLTFGPDPATHSRCTLGGMIGNNSCGAHSVMAGKTVENIEALEILTYDGERMWVGETSDEELERIISRGGRRGEIYARLKALRDRYGELVRSKFPKIRRRVSGYNLDELLPENGFNVARALVGSEGTCAFILQAKAKLVYSPPVRVLAVLGYADIYLAGDRTPAILPYKPVALEGLDEGMINDMRKKRMQLEDIALLPKGGAWLLVEFGSETVEEAKSQARAMMEAERSHAVDMVLYDSATEVGTVWAIREAGAGATNSVPGEPETYPGWEDAAVEPARVGDYLRDFRRLLDKYGYRSSLYGHFGDGCIHGRITFDLKTLEGIAHWRRFLEQATDLVVAYGGSISGEHGDGQARAELLPRMFGPELMEALREFKAIWDPGNKMNPGKLINAYRVEEFLRTGPDYRPLKPQTNFSFFADQRSFANAAGRCVGVAKCRRHEGGTMCPSYRATGEEMHSTRGRARLLFELLQGEPLKDLWRNESVKQALDLCLACKGCKGECPVQVDMATYKAEFLSHYYDTHPRPRQAYTMGLIHRWARIASKMPGLVNFFTQTPPFAHIAKRIAGMAPQRSIPKFAATTFTRWFARRPPGNQDKPRVILWPDTFNNHFHPETAMAAVEVLEAAGYQVTLPTKPLCCGRALYDFGMLGEARRLLEEILEALAPDIEAGIPIVGLEPACVTVFRDELVNLFPDNEAAVKLSRQAYLLSEFLMSKAEYQPPPLKAKALVHGHCHHKAVLGMKDELALLQKLGLELSTPDTGCCGMSGAFGFDPDKYEVSMKIGEQALLPAVRAAADDTLIIADGYSCREQIEQCTPRRALHIAEVLRMALREGAK